MKRCVSIAAMLVALGLTVPANADRGPRPTCAKPAKKPKKPAVEEPPPPPPPPKAEPAAAKPAAEPEAGGALKRGERVEFDARLIQGQTTKAGAVYLFERASSNLRSMVRQRATFKDKIVRIVYPAKESAP